MARHSLAWGSYECLLFFLHNIAFTLDSASRLFRLPRQLKSGPCHKLKSLLKNISNKHVRLRVKLGKGEGCHSATKHPLETRPIKAFFSPSVFQMVLFMDWPYSRSLSNSGVPQAPLGLVSLVLFPAVKKCFQQSMCMTLRWGHQLPRKLSILHMFPFLASFGSSCLDWPSPLVLL